MKNYLSIALFFVAAVGQSGTITIVGNGAGGGPIFATSTTNNIDIGTRVRVGTFTNETTLNTTIANFITTNNPTSYSDTLAALNSNFLDLGTAVTNYGSSSQTANGGSSFTPSTSLFGFNNITALSINGGATNNWTTFNGTMTSVNYSLSIGPSKNLYIWTAFNNEIAIVRNADGTGTGAWVTPSSDASNVTLNLSGLQSSAGGTMQTSEVLLGKVLDYSTGSDLILLIPEPSISSLLVFAAIPFLTLRRSVKSKGVI